MILDAVARSGYPLQARAAEIARSSLGAVGMGAYRSYEEWSFLDSESGVIRQLDALIQREILDIDDVDRGDPSIPTDPRALLRYELDLLIECKQAELPYIFFTRSDLTAATLPILIGLPHRQFEFGPPGEEPIVSMSVEDAAIVDSLPRLDPEPAISVSRCYRKGKGLELSGEDVFRSLTAPIRKAIEHYQRLSESDLKMRLYHDIRLLHPIVVLDAPMYACEARGQNVKIRPISMARLSLSEPAQSAIWHAGYNRRSSLDFVHVDQLGQYCDLALNRATALAGRLNLAAIQILTGRAVAQFGDAATETNADEDPLADLKPAMTPAEASRWIQNRFIDLHT